MAVGVKSGDLERLAAEERFRRLFAGEPNGPIESDGSRPVLQSAAAVYSNVYSEAIKRHGAAPAARQEADAAVLAFLETVLSFTPKPSCCEGGPQWGHAWNCSKGGGE